ncbi:ferredoxin--NADP reductase [Desulfobulbus elongatus]|uniref:ferredoxin--NADP reductase n=1 Tax=Desulfobulbus elongatus TaxID=53332 RepID=UPI000A0040FF|nr:FAD-binding oxidoreductase [Desulfobulbus elongatus]
MIGATSPLHTVAVTAREWLNGDTFVLTCDRPVGFSFQAGQHVTLALDGEEREYTLISPPDAPDLRFLIKRVADGRLSGVLSGLPPGTALRMSRAKGYLTYRPTDRAVVFVANGVGVAPFVAMAAAGIAGFTMIQGARTPAGLFFRHELSRAAGRSIPCLSGVPDQAINLTGLHWGRVTDYVARHLEPGQYDFYLCGSRAMVTDMTLLLDQLCPDARIYSEAYT